MPAKAALCLLSMLVCLASAAPAFAQLPPNMRSYYVAVMKKGPAWTADPSPETHAVQQAQEAYLQRLETEKKLIGAGPISDSSELGAVWLLDVPSKADAERLVGDDPAVKANRLSPLVLEWFAEKGIGDGYRRASGGEARRAGSRRAAPVRAVHARSQPGAATEGARRGDPEGAHGQPRDHARRRDPRGGRTVR